jgi:ATP-dependent DNA ligase
MQNDLFAPQELIPNEKTWYLISKDTKGKIRVAIISYKLINPDDKQTRYFEIHRISGQYGGKRTEQPTKTVDRGKVNRSMWDQVMLEAKHLVKEKLDKGYKEIEKDPDEYSESELMSILGEIVSNQDGVPKPMLAKQADKVTNPKIYDKVWLASRKIDGLRASIYLGKDGVLHTASRGAMNYDAAMFQIIENKDLIYLFKNIKGLILDGEAYHHGYTLQQLNSIARTQKTAVDYDVLQFYWYDIVDPNSTFDERWALMRDIRDEMNLIFDPEKHFEEGELRIQFVPQVEVSGWDNMMKLHNQYVSEGWEGLVIRDPDALYRPNGRTNDMIKIKIYKDDCFKVIGKEAGLRGSEDMVFIMQMPDGRTFKAKPFGDRLQKEEYWNNFEEKYNGHIGECKFFYYSDDGIPLQPAFKAFRDDLE